MSHHATLPNIFPVLRYKDAARALDWLEKAFGFERKLVVPGDGGTIAHAQLQLGAGFVMLGTVRDDDLRLRSPADLGAVSQAIYVWLEEVDTHYARARDAGAEIVMELQDMDYGSREYSCRDLEGYVWSFGTYRPE
jgi:uncharacterized glyoxalase superfamily protein PhnB